MLLAGLFCWVVNTMAKYKPTEFMAEDSRYDKKSADQAVPKLKKADLQIFEAIALNYGMVRKWIADRYPLIFPAQKQSFGKKSGSWAEIFDDIVGDDLKDQDKYAEIPINSVFRFITRKIKESRKQREHAAKLH